MISMRPRFKDDQQTGAHSWRTIADLVLGGARVALQQLAGSHDHAGRTEAALEAVLVPERLLHGMQIAIEGQAFDGNDLGAVGLHGEHAPAFDDSAVERDGACAADGSLAADVRAGESGDFSVDLQSWQRG